MLYIFLGLLILPPAGGFQFTSSYGGQTVFAVSGSSVTFHWSISGDVGTVNWGIRTPNKNDITTLVSLDQSGMVPFSPPAPNNYIKRVNGSFNGDSVSGSANYILSGITKSDEREYGCQARSSDYTASLFDIVKLVVVETPHITLTHNTNTSYNEGSEVDIRCNATGSPEPDVMWTHNGHVLSSGSKTAGLSFNAIRRVQAGMYICKANNSVGSKQKSLTLIVNYKPTIKTAVTSAAKSWIGQIVDLKCEADGRPTPTITWKKQDGSKVKEVTATWNIASVEMKTEGDFGNYTCEANNTVGPAAAQTVEIKQIKAPGSPIIITTAADIQATSLTVKWNPPTTNGGSPITAYRVVILQGCNEIRNEDFIDLNLPKEKLIGSLDISTNYTVRVYARNIPFEGIAGEKMIRTKFQGVPAAAEILGLPKETNNTEITLRWSEPENNGKPIKNYNVYQRTMKEDGTPRAWYRISVIIDLSDLQVSVQLEKGKIYEFVVTVTNEIGESLKEEKKIKKITVVGGVPSAVKLKVEQKDDKITLTWEKPDSNGAAVTKYFVYHRVANAKDWEELTEIPAGSPLQYVFEGEKGKEYEFVVTASNRYGESPKADIKSSKLSAGTTKPPENQTGSPGGSLHAAYVTVIVVLVITIVLLSVMLWRMRRRLSHKYQSCGSLIAMEPLANQTTDNTNVSTVAQANDTHTYATPIGGDYMPLHPSTRSWEIMREQVDILKVIGKGAFSQVAKATVKNVRGYQEYITVAVKMLKANAPASDRKDLLSELDLMKKLKPHPHVIKLIGCVTESGDNDNASVI